MNAETPIPSKRQQNPKVEVGREFTRRRVLQGSALATAMAALSRMPARASSGGAGIDAERFLVTYLMNGYTQDAYDECQTIGYDAFLAKQLDATFADPEWDALHAIALNIFDKSEVELLAIGAPNPGFLSQLVRDTKVFRAFTTARQGQQMLTEYFVEHMHNIDANTIPDGQITLHPTHAERVRGAVTGTYGGMLSLLSKGASMLRYLNNETSCGLAFNENYGREFLELYGPGLCYQDVLWTRDPANGIDEYEDDVKAVSRAFTGMTFDGKLTSAGYGTYFYDGDPMTGCHDYTPKFVNLFNTELGTGSASGIEGEAEADFIFAETAKHFSTAWNVCSRLVRWFLRDVDDVAMCPHQDPAVTALIIRIGQVFFSSQGNLRLTFEALFDKNELSVWRPDLNPKAVRPETFVNWSIRTLGIPFDLGEGGKAHHVPTTLQSMGRLPGGHPAPDGYDAGAQTVIDTLIQRWDHAFKVAHDQYSFLKFHDTDAVDYFSGANLSAIGAFLNQRMTGGVWTAAEEAFIQNYFNVQGGGGVSPQLLRDCLALGLITPSSHFHCG